MELKVFFLCLLSVVIGWRVRLYLGQSIVCALPYKC
jgi:hypothetical protein